ncbi:nicotinate phosphoribosyltransferase [Paraferrimonas sedimenticola]|uniref:Nicotinate phosphoribosyltransferase n=1 Tax=Paraferrimonas sedimenticola TaxID=375674 RepID=A0AA37RUH6_9GAMM|nr:nicotinate phosphoribosyltransferase [Paraferrimonas sedimenticola]GLP95084.1 nicotinate phosphoribosyltransferase 1 [Paraferrimonas sedimenticola]
MRGQFRPGRIIQSLLDTDLYKLFTHQAIFELFTDTEVAMQFQVRSDEDFSPYVAEVRAEVEALSDLRFSQSDIWYLQSLGRQPGDKCGYFKPAFINYLSHYKLNPRLCQISVNNQAQLAIEAKGSWLDVIHFEVFVLTIVSEIRHRHCFPEASIEQQKECMAHKVADFLDKAKAMDLDLSGLQVFDFGTRRRVSYTAHWEMINYLRRALPKDVFAGTSNMHIAREMQLDSFGTQGHEWFMAHQQLAVLHKFQRKALRNWIRVYQGDPGYALTDTVGMDAFFRDFDRYSAKLYDGLRQDSGDPALFAKKAIAHYQRLGIDPRTKAIIFSDAQDLNQELLNLYQEFGQQVQVQVGIGSKFSADIPGCNVPSIVMKLVQTDGYPVAKLSDSPEKSSCLSQAFETNLKETFNYPK